MGIIEIAFEDFGDLNLIVHWDWKGNNENSMCMRNVEVQKVQFQRGIQPYNKRCKRIKRLNKLILLRFLYAFYKKNISH